MLEAVAGLHMVSFSLCLTSCGFCDGLNMLQKEASVMKDENCNYL